MPDRVARYQAYQWTPAQAIHTANCCGCFECGFLAPWFSIFAFDGTLSVRSCSYEKQICRGGGEPVCLALSVLSVSFPFLFFCVSFVLFLCFVSLFCFVFVTLPVASPPGEGTRQRPDWTARQIFFCRPGYFSSTRRGFLFFCFLRSLFDFIFGVFVRSFALALSHPIYFLLFFVCFFVPLGYVFQFLFQGSFFIFLSFHFSLSGYRGSWRRHVVAWHCTTALYLAQRV